MQSGFPGHLKLFEVILKLLGFFFMFFDYYPYHICEEKLATLIVLEYIHSLFTSPNNV